MEFKNDIDHCIAALEKGGTILYPTDTIWGLGCDAQNEAAVAKIFSIKERPSTKSMIILLADEKAIGEYCKAPSTVIKKMISDPSRPLTVIYPEAKNLATNLINDDGTIAIRIVKDEFCIALINALGKPLVSTSANISGDAAPENFSAISEKIKNPVDYIVTYRQQDTNPHRSSRILKWTDDENIIVIRD